MFFFSNVAKKFKIDFFALAKHKDLLQVGDGYGNKGNFLIQ